MVERSRVLLDIKEGVISASPLIFGFFPVAMAFGLISKTADVSFVDTCLFSLLVFAGASQFMAIDMLKTGMATGNIILATFLLNLRHLMMSASLSLRLKEIKKPWLVFIAFGITDETFSLISLSNRKPSVSYLLSLHGVAYLSWASGTITGYLAGTVLPLTVQNSLGIGLYSMFMALLAPEIKKSLPVLFLSISSGILYGAFSYFKILSSSWSLIAASILAAGIGALFIKNEETETKA